MLLGLPLGWHPVAAEIAAGVIAIPAPAAFHLLRSHLLAPARIMQTEKQKMALEYLQETRTRTLNKENCHGKSFSQDSSRSTR